MTTLARIAAKIAAQRKAGRASGPKLIRVVPAEGFDVLDYDAPDLAKAFLVLPDNGRGPTPYENP